MSSSSNEIAGWQHIDYQRQNGSYRGNRHPQSYILHLHGLVLLEKRKYYLLPAKKQEPSLDHVLRHLFCLCDCGLDRIPRLLGVGRYNASRHVSPLTPVQPGLLDWRRVSTALDLFQSSAWTGTVLLHVRTGRLRADRPHCCISIKA